MLAAGDSAEVAFVYTGSTPGRRASVVSATVVRGDGGPRYDVDVSLVADVEAAVTATVVEATRDESGRPSFLLELTPAEWAEPPRVIGHRSHAAIFEVTGEPVPPGSAADEDGRHRSVRVRAVAVRRAAGFAAGDAAVLTLLTDSRAASSIDVSLDTQTFLELLK